MKTSMDDIEYYIQIKMKVIEQQLQNVEEDVHEQIQEIKQN